MKSNQLKVLSKSNPLDACSNLCVTLLLSGSELVPSLYTSPGTQTLQAELSKIPRTGWNCLGLGSRLGVQGGLGSLVPARTAQHTLGKTFLAGSDAWKLTTATIPSPHWAVATREPDSTPATRKLTHSVRGCPRARGCKLHLENFARFIWTSWCWTWDFLRETMDIFHCSALAVIRTTCIEGIQQID